MPPLIQKRKALINGLGVAILPKTKMVLEVYTKGTILVSVKATQHEGAEVFITDGFNGMCLFGNGRIFGMLMILFLSMSFNITSRKVRTTPQHKGHHIF